MGASHSFENNSKYTTTSLVESAFNTESAAASLYRILNEKQFPKDLALLMVEYLSLQFVSINPSTSLLIRNNVVLRTKEYSPRNKYELAFVAVHFDETRTSRFNFEIVHQQFNVVIGCMKVYKTSPDINRPFSLSMINKLLKGHNNHSVQANFIGSGQNGYSYDSAGLLVHNNHIQGMSDGFCTGSIVTIQYNPTENSIEFFIDGLLQKALFEDVVVRSSQRLIPIIALSDKNECVKLLSFDDE